MEVVISIIIIKKKKSDLESSTQRRKSISFGLRGWKEAYDSKALVTSIVSFEVGNGLHRNL